MFSHETDENRSFAEARVKALTGNDTVTARFLYQEEFDFKPQFKLTLCTNHRPEIRGTDDAIWDRVLLVPFEVRLGDEDVNLNLQDELRTELPGILAWIVEGCLRWQRDGLNPPNSVLTATSSYRADQDALGRFLEESTAREGQELTETLYEAYRAWCSSADEGPILTKKQFAGSLRGRGYEQLKLARNAVGRKGRGWNGIKLRE